MIVLVPEIALTPQTVGRFAARLGEEVAVLHSGLTPGQRADEWRRLREGRARVCVGPRSAIFAPVREPGLIVIDEEHDSSYKQEGVPRYDAREVARKRASDSGAALVCGTATPRCESWLELERVELRERADGSSLPAVELLDMREGAGARGPLHERTRAELGRIRDEGGRAMMLLNRRGWSPHLACNDCGTPIGCPDCDVSLVMHREVSKLACHHCGFVREVPETCETCGSSAIARHGVGTERLTDLIAELVHPLPVFRLDSDSVGGEGGHAAVLRRFGAAASGVLVGTQMVAKGHDFADVRLCVVLDADATLRFPDFRAEERTFSMVTQLAGRCGRGISDAKVLVQTLTPEAPAIAHAAGHDSAGFLAGELDRRRELGYPPYSSLVKVELAAADPAAVNTAGRVTAAAITAALPADIPMLGPAPQLRLRGKSRRQLLVKADPARRTEIIDAVRSGVEQAIAEPELKGVAVAVDVDPQ